MTTVTRGQAHMDRILDQMLAEARASGDDLCLTSDRLAKRLREEFYSAMVDILVSFVTSTAFIYTVNAGYPSLLSVGFLAMAIVAAVRGASGTIDCYCVVNEIADAAASDSDTLIADMLLHMDSLLTGGKALDFRRELFVSNLQKLGWECQTDDDLGGFSAVKESVTLHVRAARGMWIVDYGESILRLTMIGNSCAEICSLVDLHARRFVEDIRSTRYFG